MKYSKNIFCLVIFLRTCLGSNIFERRNVQIKQPFTENILLRKLKILNRLICFTQCIECNQCHYVLFNSSICHFSSSFIFEKINSKKINLINYWPIENGETKDLVASKDLYESVNVTFTQDRFGNNNSALSFHYGYIRAPKGIYFQNEFTVLAWIKLKEYVLWQKFFDFGNGKAISNVVVSLSNDYSNRNSFHIFNLTEYRISTINELVLDEWVHLGFVLENGKMSIFKNGSRDAFIDTGEQYPVDIVDREHCYFGKSNWDNSNAVFDCDDIKFFDRALTETEIQNENIYGNH
ncbi:glycoside hydrolase [Brachionus plicatilis]|uniref:Glycoside hydrolase n=1 Tax=Brachionus plicatilis TaxID=10195 RepID=A0A3M7PWS0_BRAPC|nr:glycoside hydrolase [Brachionus plicatilis]